MGTYLKYLKATLPAIRDNSHWTPSDDDLFNMTCRRITYNNSFDSHTVKI